MLIIARKQGERIVIDGPCVLQVVEFRGRKQVKLGFEGEAEVWREELVKKEDESNDKEL